MSKNKKFSEWYEEDEWGDGRLDSKRYDRKKASIKEARRDKMSKRTEWEEPDE